MVDMLFYVDCDRLINRGVDKEDASNHIIFVSFPVTTTGTLENTNTKELINSKQLTFYGLSMIAVI